MRKTTMNRSRSIKKPLGKLLVALVLSFLSLGMSQSAKACLALDVPVLLNQAIIGNNLVLNWESVNVWACNGYSVEVQVVCNGQAFPAQGNSFMSPNLNKTVVTPMAYPTQSISLDQFCPGQVYQFRAREVYMSTATNSNWTATFSFTVPGTYVPPTLNPSATSNIYCPPLSPTLSAGLNNACGNPISFAWTPTAGLSNPTVANPVASPTASTIYTVTANGGPWGCWNLTGTVAIAVNVPGPPAVGTIVATPSLVCVGKSTSITVSSYAGSPFWQSSNTGSGPWQTVATTASIIAGPLLNTTTCFRLLVTTCTGTLTSNIVCVNANQTPTLNPTVIHPTCQNTVASVNIGNPGSSGNPITATWSPGPSSFGSSSTTATYQSIVGPVQVTLGFADGCVSTTSFAINPIPPVPNFTILNVSGSTSITCATPTVVLNAAHNYTAPVNYVWTSNSTTFATQEVSLTAQGTFTVLVFDPVTMCQAQRTISIGFNTTPPLSSVSPSIQNIICGPGIVATATGCAISPTVNVTHTWYYPNTSLPPVQGGGQCSIFGPGIGTNTYVLTDNVNGCSTTKTIEVTSALGFPTYSLTSVRSFTLGCATRSFVDVHIVGQNTNPPPGGGAMSFTVFQPGFSAPSYTFGSILDYTFTAPGNYTVSVRDNFNNCETRVILPIIQDIFLPNLSASAATRTLTCRTPTVLLEAASTNTTPVAYQWAFVNTQGPGIVPSFSIPVSINNNTAITGTVINNYTLQVTNLNNECKSTTVVPMYQNIRPPRPIINGVGEINCIDREQTLSNGSALDEAPGFQPLVGTGVTRWEGPSPQEPLDNFASYVAKTVGVYTMSVMDMNNGCVTFTTALVADGRIYPVVSGEQNQFLDCGNASFKLTPAYIPSVGLTYRWVTEPGVVISTPSLSSLSVTEPGDYQVVVINSANGCGAGRMFHVSTGTLSGNFEADAYQGYAPLTVNFTNLSASTNSANGTASITSVWSYGNGTTKTTSNVAASSSAVYQQPGSYTVALYAHKGACIDTVYKVIVVDIPSKIEIPNVFTPNGDNSNDIFFIKAANLTEITAIIYDRWGNKVYELTTDKGNIAWDGKNMTGKDSPDGTYFYIITAKGADGMTYDKKGNVSLYR